MRALSLFSGIGGIDLAAEWAGIETVAFCEYADFPRKVLNKHWPNVPIFKDVKNLDKAALEKAGVIDRDKTIKLIHGGFPCQPYSIAGKRKGKKDDRDLWAEMFRIINELGPDWVVGENVANFANMELDRTLFDLESEGYETTSLLFPACGVDAKHQRFRTFVVANSGEKRHLCGRLEEFATEAWEQTFTDTVQSSNIFHHSDSFGWETNNLPSEVTEARERNRKPGSTDSFPTRWSAEPRVGRVAHGIPDRVDRIGSLGNAVVPQQAFPIFSAIMEIERVNNPTK